MTDKNRNGVILAETAGFCWGVKRAIDITLAEAKKHDGPIFTYGPLIHNPQVIETLESKEVYEAKEITDLNSGSTVVIRTHGVTPDVRRELKEQKFVIADATCPLVAKVQGIIKKHANRGYSTVIIGDAGHAEIVGLLGFTKGRGYVVGEANDVDALPAFDNLCVVSQTTCDITRYSGILNKITERFPDAVVTNTICEATEERQSEVLALANKVDAIVVVGGKNSANTKRLGAIATDAGVATFLVETEEELDKESVGKYEKIGVTAGASTPTWMIERVVNKLSELRDERPRTWMSGVTDIITLAVISNGAIAAGAAFMTLANATLAGFEPTWTAAYIAASYIFSMYVANQLNDVATLRRNEPNKIGFYLTHKKLMTIAAVLSALSALSLASLNGIGVTTVVGFAFVLGLGYTVKWFPKSAIISIHRLKDIPASKDFFVGVAWGVITALVPAMIAGADLVNPSLFVAGFFTFTLVYIRSVLSDIRDIEGDQLVGRETIPILIGKQATKIFLAILSSATAGALVGAYAMEWTDLFGVVLLFSIFYTGFYLLLFHWRIINEGLKFDLAVDGVFHVTGLLAVAWILFN